VIAKITRGASFRGPARYVLDERRGLDRDHQAEMIGGNMAGRTSGELPREFEASSRARFATDRSRSPRRLGICIVWERGHSPIRGTEPAKGLSAR
jgi:hypothetical protein